MAALGSALSTQLCSTAPAAWKRSSKAQARKVSTVTRATASEPKIEEVAAAVDSKILLPKGEYCVNNSKTFRRKTR